MATNKKISPAMSMKGWRFKTWVDKNKDKIKQGVSIMAGVGVFVISKNALLFDLGLATGVKIAVDLGLDALDFWLTDVKL